MSRIGKIARRSFLIGSAAIAGGVAFGLYAVRKTPENPLLAGLAPGELSFNPWVKITADRITLITPHADLGQGAMSMQALLIAEELDVDPAQVATEFGPPAAAYWNTALGAESAPFLPGDTGLAARATRGAMNAAFKLVGMQGTGGSSAVPDSFVKLRQAGAMARETLKRVAAQRHGVDVALLRSENGAVILPDGTAVPYTALAADAAQSDPVQEVPLRPDSDWRLIGKPMRRLDILPKSTGTQVYGIDLKVEGMVHAAVRLNPRRGVLLSHDATAAKAMRGVAQVLPIRDGVAVIADNTWRAMQAAQAVVCDWGPAPYPAEMADHWAAVEAGFDPAHLDKEWRADGDMDAGLSAADVVSAEYRAPYLAHQPLEPLNAIVRYLEAETEVWTAHQLPRMLQDLVAGVTGQGSGQITLHNQFAGGSFGHRLEFDHVLRAAEIARQMPGTPVKLTYSREEDFAQDFTRPPGMARGRGTVANGQVQAVEIVTSGPSPSRSQLGRAGYSVPGPDNQLPAGIWNAPYAPAAFRVRAHAVEGLAPVSSWRSVGASLGGFFLESFLDELIHAAGADPMAERLRLCNDPVARGVLEAVAELSGWQGPSPAPGQGRGVALVQSFGVNVAEVVDVRMTDAGLRIDRVFCVADVGRVVDPVNIENQIQGAVIWGLGHAMNCEITYADGMAEQTNYDSHSGMRLDQCPEIVVRVLENAPEVRGIGEPPVPPAAPALANAIFAATGQRLREMPFGKFVDFA
ncbi:isoquinoline 1-oxidoreductase beta subunit [Gemmobacter caeni]|uniref:Isoquinoline 1-oxidoreductase beta subunit n=1 Tax=Gemmobacter caeni TaxID=589035 RepID=A0A2T6B0J2_9RHOB|nr:molybdopterin cofactor-binding domain-containing protein [Gemmobacter caeni]PTX49533.1 isoquinoline 1-oxidoreductase beta subunit [Gemmobacter caeni]TWJ00420.1 isoquinoline 1-oxidoreductase beta subunit [Gemmobacter caeni]